MPRKPALPPTTVGAVDAFLKDLRLRSEDLAGSPEAATLRALAGAIDDPKNSATSRSMCAKALYDGMDTLRALAPAVEARDALDELAQKRELRLAAAK